jgi:uncharacterized protein YjiS (DUF1127 family)
MAQTNFVTPATFGSETDVRRAFQRQILSMAWDACMAPFAAAAAAWTERRRIDRGIAELSGLSDRMLKDIGVGRHDIERIVRNGRDAVESRA